MAFMASVLLMKAVRTALRALKASSRDMLVGGVSE